MSSTSFVRRLAGAAGLVVFAACSEGPGGPTPLIDPAGTSARLDAVHGALAAPVVRSFTRFSGGIAPPAAGLGPAVSLLVVASPALARPGESPYALGARRALRLRELAPELSTGASLVRIIPDTLWGSVFRWDSASSGYYRAAPGGGPANGMRFILYAVDDAGQISYPLTEVGYVDLLDESTETSARLHINVRSVDGSLTFVDYVVAITPAANGFSAAASGSITGALSFAVTVSASATQSAVTTAVDATLDVTSSATRVELHEGATFTASGGAIAIDFRLSPPGETVQLQGLFTVSTVTPDSAAVTVNATIRANGRVLATVQGAPPHELTFRDGEGTPMPGGPVLDMLGKLMQAVGDVFQFIHGLFGPVGNLFGGV